MPYVRSLSGSLLGMWSIPSEFVDSTSWHLLAGYATSAWIDIGFVENDSQFLPCTWTFFLWNISIRCNKNHYHQCSLCAKNQGGPRNTKQHGDSSKILVIKNMLCMVHFTPTHSEWIQVDLSESDQILTNLTRFQPDLVLCRLNLTKSESMLCHCILWVNSRVVREFGQSSGWAVQYIDRYTSISWLTCLVALSVTSSWDNG